MELLKRKEQKKKERAEAIEQAYEASAIDGEVTVADLASYTGKTEKCVRKWLDEHGGFEVNNSVVIRTGKKEKIE